MLALEAATKKASKDHTNANYHNILPSNLRQGNMNVMPLLPKNTENIPQSHRARLKRVMQQSAYVLAEYQQKNS